MADLWTNRSLKNMMDAWLAVPQNLWVLLCCENVSAASVIRDADTLSAITLDESDGANYVRKKLANVSIAVSDSTDLVTLTCDDIVWTALGNGTRQIKGYLVYHDADDDGAAGDDASNVPVAYRDLAGLVNPGGGNYTLDITVDGLLALLSEH